MKKSLYFLFAIITLVSCNKDDTSEINISIENLAVTEITHDTAKITWQSSTNSDSETVYTIYVNQEMIVEQLQENTYILENLAPDTLYDVKLVARTQSSNSEMNIEFRTLPTEQLYLKNLTIDEPLNMFQDEIIMTISYNDINRIEKKRFIYGSSDRDSDFSYNDLGKVDYQTTRSSFHYAYYLYEPQDLSEVKLRHSSCTGGQYPFCFNRENSYYFDAGLRSYSRESKYTRLQFMPQGPPQIEIINYMYEASYTDGKLSSAIETNDQTGEVKTFNFEYLNGNLIRFDANGTVLEIRYDDKKSWHTFESGYDVYFINSPSLNTYRTASSLLFLEYELRKQLWLFPQLHHHINNNNPLSYSIDGEIVQEFEYEYNMHGYPTKFTAGEYGQILLEYN